MTYAVKETFYTLQGEGFHAGRPAVFLRFAGCNLWSGREADRASAVCRFCDTDFRGTDGDGGGTFGTPTALAAHVAAAWSGHEHEHAQRFVVCTGGEPLLQLDAPAIDALRERGFVVAVETNGTVAAPPGLDWLCVSPKANAPLVQRSGDELKLVYRQPGLLPDALAHLPFTHRFLQPMDGPDVTQHTADAIAYCLRHPQWRLSVQTHKAVGIR